MSRIEKTVFISYRRTNLPWALAIFQNLKSEGYDVFFDYLSIPSGDFESIIVENIKARAHFVVILTPSALERCNEPGDWLRREIETAMDEKRNIVPLMLESFDFGSPLTISKLTGKLENLKKYNGLRLHSEYFFEGMDRLRKQYLNVSLDTVIHPISEKSKPVIEAHQNAASEARRVEQKQLTAQEWLEEGNKQLSSNNLTEAIRLYSKAILLDPNYGMPYNNRGIARREMGDFVGAIKDHNKAIRLEPDIWINYSNRGLAYEDQGDHQKAISDYNKAIQIDPSVPAPVYNNRGNSLRNKGDLDGAMKDFNEALRLDPKYAAAYMNRGIVQGMKNKFDLAIREFNQAIRIDPNYADAYSNRAYALQLNGELDRAIKDYAEAIRLEPNHKTAYYNRAALWEQKRNYSSAILDYEKYLELGGGLEDDDQQEVEGIINKLKSKMAKKKTVKKKKSPKKSIKNKS